MLKRFSASLNPSLTPSHSSQSIALPTYASYGNGNSDAIAEHTYPRTSGMSTPYSSSSNLEVAGHSTGYFGQQVSSSAASSSSSSISAGGRLSPAISTAVSRNASPLPSPRLSSYSPIPSEGGGATFSNVNANYGYGTYTPPPPIDRPTLQKNLKCLETLLVAVDEYRELNARLAKVEKRLGKAAKELCTSMNTGGKDDTNGIGSGSTKGKEGGNSYYSTCECLSLSLSLALRPQRLWRISLKSRDEAS
jgi:hypothetical protein